MIYKPLPPHLPCVSETPLRLTFCLQNFQHCCNQYNLVVCVSSFVVSVWEAPPNSLHPLFGHCPNSDRTLPSPPLHSNGHSGALYFRADLSKCHLNSNFHCISAPNRPGKGSDPPNQANAPLNMDNSSRNKCPKPSGQRSRPPPIWAMPE